MGSIFRKMTPPPHGDRCYNLAKSALALHSFVTSHHRTR